VERDGRAAGVCFSETDRLVARRAGGATVSEHKQGAEGRPRQLGFTLVGTLPVRVRHAGLTGGPPATHKWACPRATGRRAGGGGGGGGGGRNGDGGSEERDRTGRRCGDGGGGCLRSGVADAGTARGDGCGRGPEGGRAGSARGGAGCVVGIEARVAPARDPQKGRLATNRGGVEGGEGAREEGEAQ